jgi:low temperature requirement protein LtrA
VFAAAIEEALLHPTESMNSFAITALAVGPALYLAGFVIGNLRATGRILHTRLVGLIVIVAIAVIAGPRVSALASTAAVATAIIAIAAIEGASHPRSTTLSNPAPQAR